MYFAVPFIPGVTPANPGPLSRYIPPLTEGVAKAWLTEQLSISEESSPWVLDPFGASPRLVREAAQTGCRVLVAANNPVSRFLIELTADPPSEDDLKAALAELGSAPRGDQRMEQHIRSLYQTECSQCGRVVMADAFLWERHSSAPYARIYTCRCGASGEFPVNAQDVRRAQEFSAVSLHRSRALERIAPPNDPDRIHAEEALSVYIPRSVYALFTLINKLDGLMLPPKKRKLLEALLLRACDQANTMWQVPTARERPRQLTIPPRFRENNLWLALEKGIQIWAHEGPGVPLTVWPELPPPGGICLFKGRFRDLCDQIHSRKEPLFSIQAVITALPRPNQAFWTLSALWAGWLWGREAAGPIKRVLRRRRYDWNWHTAGLFSAFNNMAELLPAGTPILGLIGEAETGFLAAALIAANMAGLKLTGIALRGGTEQAQLHWRINSTAPAKAIAREEAEEMMRRAAVKAGSEFLRECGQPAVYLFMHAAAMTGIIQTDTLRARISAPEQEQASPAIEGKIQESPEESEIAPFEQFTRVQNAIREAVLTRGDYIRYGASDSPETGYWWLREEKDCAEPLADRIEKALVTLLVRLEKCHFFDLDRALLSQFPGLMTPHSELVQVCLESYAYQEPGEGDFWRLRPQDTPSARRQDLEVVTQQLQQLAERMGFIPEGKLPMRWSDSNRQTHYWIYPITSAVIGQILRGKSHFPPSPASQSIIVLPGSRANLVAYKLRHDPHLRSLCATNKTEAPERIEKPGWRFVKFRQVRSLLENPLLRRENFEEQLGLDPLTYSAPQLRLF